MREKARVPAMTLGASLQRELERPQLVFPLPKGKARIIVQEELWYSLADDFFVPWLVFMNLRDLMPFFSSKEGKRALRVW